MRMVYESKRTGKMLATFNSTFIALIPKSDDPSSFQEFRSISLCNCINKIVAKIIVKGKVLVFHLHF